MSDSRKGYIREYMRRWRAENPDKVKAMNQRRTRKRATDPEYVALQKLYNARWRAANPDYRTRDRAKRLRAKYGLTPEEYDALVVAQRGECAICGEINVDEKLHVDHCHSSGRVRALLCSGCNVSIGRMRENPAVLRAAADYLEKHQH